MTGRQAYHLRLHGYGLTQAEWARLLGVTKSTVERYERDRPKEFVRLPACRYARDLLHALDTLRTLTEDADRRELVSRMRAARATGAPLRELFTFLGAYFRLP